MGFGVWGYGHENKEKLVKRLMERNSQKKKADRMERDKKSVSQGKKGRQTRKKKGAKGKSKGWTDRRKYGQTKGKTDMQ